MKTALSRMSQTTTFKTKVPNARLKKANAVLQKLGLSAGEAFNLMLAADRDSKGAAFCRFVAAEAAAQR
jgi:hypothetical protein